MDELKQLKSVLRSLAVSCPVQLTLSALLRDYRNMMGEALPAAKHGYRDPMQFLKERCGDCFLGSGPNTILIPIIPDRLKHIDDFVTKQKVNPKAKFKGKRKSVQESNIRPAPDLIVSSFVTAKGPPGYTPLSNSAQRPNVRRITKYETQASLCNRPITKTNPAEESSHGSPVNNYKSTTNLSDKENNRHQDSGAVFTEAYKNFLRKRLPIYDSSQDLDKSYKDSDSGKCTSESEQRTLSSSSSSKRSQLEELKAEVTQLILDNPDGVLCTDLMKLYRERYGRELNFSRFNYTSVSALACSLAGVQATHDPAGGGSLLRPAGAAPPAAPRALAAAPRRLARSQRSLGLPETAADEEDALPWIDFDPDVFPADCMSFSESIPPAPLAGVVPGANLELMVGEVYSPSHFWVYRLGPRHHVAMEDMMDDMTKYYTSGEGAQRTLAVGAVRVGHYCSSLYERDWHRSLIVRILDSDTVKVRHVDYGTVDRVATSGLKPLLRRWASLPAQAVRARLAGVRPAARGRRWPHAACAALLRLVQDRRLVGNVARVDHEDNILELFLVDTSTERDVRIDVELVRAGHADVRAAAATHATAESYLFPVFDALETGATPNFADVAAYLRDGIALDCVHDYRRHVPAALPASPPPPSPPPPPRLDNRIPLLACLPLDSSSSESERVDSLDSRSEPAGESTLSDESEPDEPPRSPEPDPAFEAAPPPRAASAPAPTPRLSTPPRLPTPPCVPPARLTPARSLVGLPPMRYPQFSPAPSLPALPFYVFPPPAPMFHPCSPVAHQPFPPRPFPGPYPPPCYPHPQPHPQRHPQLHTQSHAQPHLQLHTQSHLQPHPQLHTQSHPQPHAHPHPQLHTQSHPHPHAHPHPQLHTQSHPQPHAQPHPQLHTQSHPQPHAQPHPQLHTQSQLQPHAQPHPQLHTQSQLQPHAELHTQSHPQPQSQSQARPPPPPPAWCEARAPPAPPQEGGAASTSTSAVTLSVSECEIFSLLSAVDANAAHWYMVDAISRAMAARPGGGAAPTAARPAPRASSSLNPEACEFRLPLPAVRCAPPPGFGDE